MPCPLNMPAACSVQKLWTQNKPFQLYVPLLSLFILQWSVDDLGSSHASTYGIESGPLSGLELGLQPGYWCCRNSHISLSSVNGTEKPRCVFLRIGRFLPLLWGDWGGGAKSVSNVNTDAEGKSLDNSANN